MKRFEWTEKCEHAFQALKEHQEEAPLLTNPMNKEKLLPVYYVSKVLQDAWARYPDIEKLALALVIASRKLRPYFQSHNIDVLTNFPLKQVLQKLDATGKLIT